MKARSFKYRICVSEYSIPSFASSCVTLVRTEVSFAIQLQMADSVHKVTPKNMNRSSNDLTSKITPRLPALSGSVPLPVNLGQEGRVRIGTLSADKGESSPPACVFIGDFFALRGKRQLKVCISRWARSQARKVQRHLPLVTCPV